MADERKPRADKRGPMSKMGQSLPIKLTVTSRSMLDLQARKAGFLSAAEYLRFLATEDRKARGMRPWDYNAGVRRRRNSTPPATPPAQKP